MSKDMNRISLGLQVPAPAGILSAYIVHINSGYSITCLLYYAYYDINNCFNFEGGCQSVRMIHWH